MDEAVKRSERDGIQTEEAIRWEWNGGMLEGDWEKVV